MGTASIRPQSTSEWPHMEEEGDISTELAAQRSQRELDDEIKKRKERQKFHDDIGVFVSMITITLIAVVVVTIKVILFYQEVDESIATFIPLEQKKGSKIKYTGHGYIPFIQCDGSI